FSAGGCISATLALRRRRRPQRYASTIARWVWSAACPARRKLFVALNNRPIDATMIETRQLTKRYGDLTAVDDISFKVEPGQVLGFLGPNGAGKSTTMKMIAGFLAPTSGSASVCGHDV